jgi:hypothetical protein
MVTVNLETPSTPDLKSPIQTPPTQTETSPASSDFHVFHQMATILSLSFLTIIYLISLGVMMDITRRGTAGAPSANPAESMTYHWNWKCQMAQTILVGSEALTLAFVLATCIVGRSRMSTIHAQERENVEYGFDRSEVSFQDLFAPLSIRSSGMNCRNIFEVNNISTCNGR